MRKNEKGDNSVMDLENFNESYTLDTIYDPNIMTRAQAVLEILKRFLRYFVHKLTLGYNEKNRKGR